MIARDELALRALMEDTARREGHRPALPRSAPPDWRASPLTRVRTVRLLRLTADGASDERIAQALQVPLGEVGRLKHRARRIGVAV
jgi:hypothetical protein